MLLPGSPTFALCVTQLDIPPFRTPCFLSKEKWADNVGLSHQIVAVIKPDWV